MATKPVVEKAEKTEKAVKARVLVACQFGQPDDVVTISPALAAAHAAEVDSDPQAVDYAESLKRA